LIVGGLGGQMGFGEPNIGVGMRMHGQGQYATSGAALRAAEQEAQAAKNRALEEQGPKGFLIFTGTEENPKVLTIKDANANPGTKVVVASPCTLAEGRFHQLWYRNEETGVLQSKMNTFALEISEDRKKVHTMPYNVAEPRQQWRLDDNLGIVNSMFVDECLEVQHGFHLLDDNVRAYIIESNKPSPWRIRRA